jgi:Uma2 family endonuclease
MVAVPRPPHATTEDFLARSPDERLELIRGTLIEKPQASSDHSLAQFSTSVRLGERFQRRPGGRYPGGWWFFTELVVALGNEIVRPDVCGYRREKMPEPPRTPIVEPAPHWVCEILSPRQGVRDRIEKMRIYFAAGVPHYWVMNSQERMLEVFRRTDIGYALVLAAKSGDRVRAEPFDAVELRVDELFGDDPEETE